MMTKFQQIIDIHQQAVATSDATQLQRIVPLLYDWGIKTRQDDGQLLWTNLSVPTSIAGTIIIGYRYQKRDASFTEDLFELNQGSPDTVVPYYKGRYEGIQAEYARTHKQQNVEARSFTSVNSCCLYLVQQNGS